MEQQKVEESLGIIWNLKEHRKNSVQIIKEKIEQGVGQKFFDKLVESGFIVIKEEKVDFTPKGEKEAIDITRRHRLAERLLFDVLGLGEREVDSNACRLEHIISMEVEKSICTLLGHPKECPHGSPIPQGECCRNDQESIESIVTSLDKMESGKEAKVAYILTRDHPQLHKLMSLGIVPGATVRVHQTFPSFVIQVEETQLALEQEVAKVIYVRRK